MAPPNERDRDPRSRDGRPDHPEPQEHPHEGLLAKAGKAVEEAEPQSTVTAPPRRRRRQVRSLIVGAAAVAAAVIVLGVVFLPRLLRPAAVVTAGTFPLSANRDVTPSPIWPETPPAPEPAPVPPKKTPAPARPPKKTVVAAVPQTVPKPSSADIVFQSPAPHSTYGSQVRVAGKVKQASAATLSWSLDGTQLGGPLTPGDDGSFSFSFSTVGLKGPLSVIVRETDSKEKSSVFTLPLEDRPGGPSLRIESPSSGSAYADSVTVAGTVGDPSDPSGTAAEVESMSWRLSGRGDLAGTISPGPDGRFSFTFAAASLTGPQSVELTAQDRNGRTSVTRLAFSGPAAAGTPAETVVPGPPVAITTPPNGGFYKGITILEGTAGEDSTGGYDSLTYDLPGRQRTGKVVLDSSGAFKLPVDLSDLSGDVTIVVSGKDSKGRGAQASVSLRDGKLKPDIVMSTPARGGSYGTVLRVAGTVNDPYAGVAAMEGIQSASWLLSPVTLSRTSSPARGTITLGKGGAFRFSLPTKGLSGDQNLTLTVIGRSGNRSDLSLRLSQGEGDLPSFAVVPGDQAATVTWEDVPFVTRYDASWASGEAPNRGESSRGVKAPLKVTGLTNGALYSLQVTALFDDGSYGSSAVARFIPLAPETLAPVVTGEYRQIKLSWKAIKGSSVYDVWRSTGSGYQKVKTGFSGTSYTDTDVEFGRDYSYAISPAAVVAPMSAPGSGRSLAFPAEKLLLLGTAPLTKARAAVLNGGYAFVASGSGGLRIVDVSTPAKPVKVGEILTTDASDVAVRGDYAYLADGEAGLRVLDMSSPREPIEIGVRKTNNARAVVLDGHYAYVADGDKGLKVIDISDARELPRVASVDTVNAQGLTLSGGRLFVADGQGGVKVFDISRPTLPALVGSIATTDARQVSIEGTLAVVADGDAGLRILDVSVPSKMKLLSTLKTGVAVEATLDEGFAYVADGIKGVTVVSLADPSRPVVFDTQRAAGATGVTVRDRLAYIAGRAGLDVVRVQIQGRSFKVAACETVGRSFDVSVSGNWAYVATHASGLKLVDVTNPGSLTNAALSGGVGTRFAQSVTVKEGLAFVADGSSGVRIVDVSPAWQKGGTPVDVGSYRPGGDVSRAVPDGKYLYVAAGDRGMQILDVSNPAAPAEVSSLRSEDASDVVLKGTWLYFADGSGGVKTLDVTDPAAPVALPTVIKGDAQRLAISGDVLLAAGKEGVSVIDVSDPRAPTLKSRYETDSALSVVARGRYAYVAEGYRGLTVLDFSNIEHPAVVSTCTEVFAMGVALKGDYAIVADAGGLKVVQILIPSWLVR